MGLEQSTQTVPESNPTQTNFTRTNNTQSLAVATRDVMQTMDFPIALFYAWQKVTRVVQ